MIMRNTLLFSRSLLLAFVLFSSAFASAQVTEKWVKRQNGDPNSPDAASGLAVDDNGNVCVTGWSLGKGTGRDFATIKYDNNSNTKWVKRYNGPGNGNDQASAIAVDDDGNIYVTGASTGNGTGIDFATIKYDDDGDTKWVKRFNGPGNGNDQAVAIAVDDDGNVYVTGRSTGNGTGTDFTTIKYDDDGDTKWVKRFNGPGNSSDHAAAIAVDDDGNVYVTGWSTGNGTGHDYTTIKYDDDGDQEWVQRYNGPINETDRAHALALDELGNVYVTGFISTILHEDGNFSDMATIKYNTSGVQQWVSIYNRTDFDAARAIAVDGSGNVFITGVGGVPDESHSRDFVTIKYNASGVQQWAEIVTPVGRGSEADVSDLTLDAAGNVYVTGALAIENSIDYITIRYNTTGIQQWRAIYMGPGNGIDIPTAIDIDENGNVYVTGSSALTTDDYATIKYKPEGVQKWVKRYNGPGDLNKGGIDEANAIAVDKDGNVHVTGGITRNNTGIDYTTYKYDNNSNRIWKKTYNGPGVGPDMATAITLDAEGNVYVTGRSVGSETGDDFATVKYDEDGDTKWVKRYNGPGNGRDRASAIAVDNAGNVYVTGVSVGGDEFGDYATIKYDRDGNTKWVKRYNGPGNDLDLASAIAVDNAGSVYITGRSFGSGSFTDYATIKYDANGNELWVVRYNGPANGYDHANALALDALGNVYVTGGSQNFNFFEDYATIKYNAAGVQQWAARYNGPADRFDIASAIAVHNDGNVYITGQSEDFGGNSDYATIKYDATGVQQWLARYNGPGNLFDFATALALDAAGNVYVTGGSWGSGTFDDYATIKYDATGVQQWLARYDEAGGSDTPLDIALDGNGNVYVTGRSQGANATNYDYATIKYEQTQLITSTTARQGLIPNDAGAAREPVAAKLQVWAYPNSFSQFINLQWSGPDKPVNITITDAMGRLVEKRTNLAASGTIKTGYQLRPGVYYAVIVQGSEKLVVRLMKTN
jgi:uncharacterized delta-60 repeat protein